MYHWYHYFHQLILSFARLFWFHPLERTNILRRPCLLWSAGFLRDRGWPCFDVNVGLSCKYVEYVHLQIWADSQCGGGFLGIWYFGLRGWRGFGRRHSPATWKIPSAATWSSSSSQWEGAGWGRAEVRWEDEGGVGRGGEGGKGGPRGTSTQLWCRL